MLNHAPIRLRLTLWYVLLLAVILAVCAAGVYLLLRHSLYENLDESIHNRASTSLNTVQHDGDRLFLPDRGPSEGLSQEEHLVRLAESLLALTRADAGQISPVLAEVGIADLVRGVVEQVRPLAIDRQVGLQLKMAPLSPFSPKKTCCCTSCSIYLTMP